MTESAEISKIEQYLEKIIPIAASWVIRIVFALLVYWIGTKVIRWVCKLLRNMLERRNADPAVVRFLQSFCQALLYFLLVVMIAMQLGLKEASVVAAIGSLGVGIGLALQGGMANLAGGVLILLLKPFSLGDYIIESSNKQEGVVKKIDMFYTTLCTIDNRMIIIPNAQLSFV